MPDEPMSGEPMEPPDCKECGRPLSKDEAENGVMCLLCYWHEADRADYLRDKEKDDRAMGDI